PIGPVITLNTVNSPLKPKDSTGKIPFTNFIGFNKDNIPVPAALIPPEEPLAAPPVFQNSPGILDNPFLTEDIGLVNNIILAEYILHALLFLSAANVVVFISWPISPIAPVTPANEANTGTATIGIHPNATTINLIGAGALAKASMTG